MFRFLHEVSSLKGFLRLVYRCCHASFANKDINDKREAMLVVASEHQTQKSSNHEIDRIVIHQSVDKCDDFSMPSDHSEPMLYTKLDPHCPTSSELFHVSLMKYFSHSCDASYLGWGALRERVCNDSHQQIASWIDNWQRRYDLPLAVCATLQSIAAHAMQHFSVTNFDFASDGSKIIETLEIISAIDPAAIIPQLVNLHAASGVHSIIVHKTAGIARISFTLPLRASESADGLKAVIFINVPDVQTNNAAANRPKSA